MQIKIPYNRRELSDDGKLVDNFGNITAELDTTVLAEEKWQKHFPELAKRESVFAYVDRIDKIKKNNANLAAIVLSNTKALYCFLPSSELPDFISFAKLFDLSNGAMIEKQMKVIETAFTAVKSGSVVSTKNS